MAACLSMGGSGWASVSSSGPAAELTAADLATGAAGSRPGTAATAAADTETAIDAVQLEQSQGSSVDGDAAAAAAAGGVQEAAVLIKAGGATAAAAADDSGKGLLARSGLNITDGGAGDGGRITAYRPSRGDTAGGAPDEHLQGGSAAQSTNPSSNGVSSAAASSNGGVGSSNGGAAAPARGAIDQAAAQQLRGLVAEMKASLTPEQLAGEYAEVRAVARSSRCLDMTVSLPPFLGACVSKSVTCRSRAVL
jgi:hypothetical protein